ncbi:MAG: phosphoadenylyl-sulfate reductase [Anaerolineae bacterium]|jgi:phosphoadenosine phosphosulfate reductase|nr:phosphoadenylyl-sulfate reductase [Anaerolineae bacterium]
MTRNAILNADELTHLNARFQEADPDAIITWAADRLMPALAATSSFQTQSVALLHMISRVRPGIPIIFLDTGYHFAETLTYRDQLVERLGLTLRVVRPVIEPAEVIRRYGDALYRHDPDLCCYIHKVKPMQQALRDLDGWIASIRRDQTPNRAQTQPLEQLPGGCIKISPLAAWTQRDLWAYIHRYDLPVHPLFNKGYQSVGCAPCTRPVSDGEDERAGRWAGTGKSECGLHTDALLKRRDENGT